MNNLQENIKNLSDEVLIEFMSSIGHTVFEVERQLEQNLILLHTENVIVVIDYSDELYDVFSIYNKNKERLQILFEELQKFLNLVAPKDYGHFNWVVTEYVSLFARYGKDTNKKECVNRMIKLFKEQPHIRKEDVIEATKFYLSRTEPKFVRLPHYFIEKGRGADKTQDILSWMDKVKNYQYKNPIDKSNILQ